MKTRLLVTGLVCIFGTIASAVGAAVPRNLAEAVETNSPFHAEWHLREGARADELLRGEPLLVHAARAGSFELCRVLVRHGADPLVRSRSGQSLVELVPRNHPDGLGVRFFLRTAAFVKQHARTPATTLPRRPGLVIVFEPTVDHTHPDIEPHYFVNEPELRGRAGEDDDKDGFIDNIYGWATVSDRPHQMNLLQLQAWSQYRERIGELADIHNRMQRGELNAGSPTVVKLKSSFLNPIAALFGASGGYSDFDFMDAIVDLSHGSHVAGITLQAGAGKATIHTISWDNFGHLQAREVDYPKVVSGDPAVWLAAFRSNSLPVLIARGRRGSDYIRAVQCGVVNGSFGLNLKAFIDRAERIVEEMGRLNPQLPSSTISDIAYEIYAYHTIPYVIAVAENPEVLFVAAAGNDDENIDLTLGSPAYLARFFPNILTVAAANGEGSITGFSNYGRKSVNAAAPGERIESLGVGGVRLLMSGTSMAAPAVSGFAARLRNDYPRMSAKEVAEIVQLTARDTGGEWKRWISSAGQLEPDQAMALASGQLDAIEALGWNLIGCDESGERPEIWSAGLQYLGKAVDRDARNARLLFCRAAVLDTAGLHSDALQAIQRVASLGAQAPAVFRSKCLIQSNLKDSAGVLETVRAMEKLVDEGRIARDAPERRDVLKVGISEARALGNTGEADRMSRSYQAAFGSEGLDLVGTPAFAARREQGRLASGDRTLTSGEYSDRFTFEGRAGSGVRIDLRSDDFDTFLIVRSPSGEQWENDDHQESSRRSQLTLTLSETGEYVVLVTSYKAGETGAYVMSIEAAEDRRSGNLGQGDGVRDTGHFFDTFTFQGEAGARVQLDLRADGFDCFLVLESPSGRRWENDDFGNDAAVSQIAVTLPESGRYVVTVTSYEPGERGNYELLTTGSPLTPAGAQATARLKHVRPDRL